MAQILEESAVSEETYLPDRDRALRYLDIRSAEPTVIDTRSTNVSRELTNLGATVSQLALSKMSWDDAQPLIVDGVMAIKGIDGKQRQNLIQNYMLRFGVEA